MILSIVLFLNIFQSFRTPHSLSTAVVKFMYTAVYDFFDLALRMTSTVPIPAEDSAPAAAADALESEGASRLYLAACFFEDKGDGRLIKQALNRIAKAKGISGVARASGLTRAGLYKALSDEGDPKLSTVLAIMKALDLTR